jgi:hypothetical protein
MNRKGIAAAVFICAALAQHGRADVIVQSSGNSEASVPLGFYAPYGTATVFEVSWSQSSAYNNVAVFANLFNPGGGGTVDYALTTAIGPGTTFAQDGIVEGAVTTPANPANLELFQLPELGPGRYYLVLSSPTPNTSWQWNFPFQPNYTTASGVSYLGEEEAQFTNLDSAYAPGSGFSAIGFPVEFEVTGTVASTPEPRYEGAIGLVLVGLGGMLHKFRLRRERGERS